MDMTIDHIAVYVCDLEGMRAFYERYFGARSGGMYHNPKTGLRTYFLSFEGGCRLELMSRPEIAEREKGPCDPGYAHLALRAGSPEAVDALTETLRQAGFTVVSGPRATGDGYYESCVLDPEGNRIEITA